MERPHEGLDFCDGCIEWRDAACWVRTGGFNKFFRWLRDGGSRYCGREMCGVGGFLLLVDQVIVRQSAM